MTGGTDQPLTGLRVLEVASIGPGPFAAMMLADHGAEVIRICRPDETPLFDPRFDITLRNRARVLTLDLKDAGDRARLCEIAGTADALIEGFRPGVMERLGLGPPELHSRNPSLVYARMTGWGQTGPLAPRAGHDINYLALSGALSLYGPPGADPVPPVNAVADFGGGAMMLVFGIVTALLSAARGGGGRIIDCAMTEGAALLQASVWSLRASGQWQETRGANLLDGGAPFYGVYRTRCGGHIAIGAIEPQFYRRMLEGFGLRNHPLMAQQMDRDRWPDMRALLAGAVAQRTRDHWQQIFEATDACVTPVLSLSEAMDHPQARARGSFLKGPGQPGAPAPAPRLEGG